MDVLRGRVLKKLRNADRHDQIRRITEVTWPAPLQTTFHWLPIWPFSWLIKLCSFPFSWRLPFQLLSFFRQNIHNTCKGGVMQKSWNYKNHVIKEGLKPGSEKFRFFFSVFEQGEKKCHYCVWITDDGLTRFDSSRDFTAVVAVQSDAWRKWVEEKIDAEDFRNLALRIDAAGEQEIDLSEMKAHVCFD